MSNSSPTRFQCELTWTIRDFETYDGGVSMYRNVYVEDSPLFSDPNDTMKWCLQLCTGKNPCYQVTILQLLLIGRRVLVPLIVQFKYAFINAEGQMVNEDLVRFRLDDSNRCFRIQSFPSDVPSLHKIKCIHENQLKIYCRVTYVHEGEAGVNSFIFDQTDSFKENYEMFLNNEEFSDVAVYVGDKKFPCHKIILATRSSVFKAMLTLDMKEKVSNRIDIRDFDENIIQEALRYIYTGKVEILEATAFELLRVADMYDLTNLKTLCENELGTMLTVENAVKIVSASNTYKLENLNARAMVFIETNLKEMIDTDAWNDLMSQPDVMKILLKKFVK